MATIAGLRGTGDWGPDERPKNFRETILFLEPNGQAPLQALLSKMGSESTDDPEFSWWEEKLTHNRVQVNGALNGVATALVVDSGALQAVKGDMYIVESAGGMWANEIVFIDADPTSDTALTIKRGFAGTTAAAIADNAYLTKIGNAFAEGTLSPKATTRNPTKLKNFCQIFKTTYEITETAKVTKSRTGPVLEKDKKRKMFDIMRDMEMASIYGRPSETLGENKKPLRTTAGLLNFITTHRTNFGSGGGKVAWNEDNLIDFFSQVFDYDGMGAGNQRLAFVGNTGLTAINKLARNSNSTRINFEKQVAVVYGMNFTKWVLPQGEIYFKTHPLFNIHPELSKAMMVINPKGIKERPLRKLKFKDNVQAPDADYQKGQWIAETGFEVNHEETMAFAGNLGG
jgi:hypothetical protein